VAERICVFTALPSLAHKAEPGPEAAGPTNTIRFAIAAKLEKLRLVAFATLVSANVPPTVPSLRHSCVPWNPSSAIKYAMF